MAPRSSSPRTWAGRRARSTGRSRSRRVVAAARGDARRAASARSTSRPPTRLPDDPVVLLENLRFDPGEEADDPAFAGRLAELADAYVDDAFGAVHRAHASVHALPELLHASGRPAVAGRLVVREVEVLTRLLEAPDAPLRGRARRREGLGQARRDRPPDRPRRRDPDRRRHGVHLDRGRRRRRSAPRLVEPDRFDEVRAARARAAERGVELLAARRTSSRPIGSPRMPRPRSCPPTTIPTR